MTPAADRARGAMSVEELARRVGMTVRTVRFYAGRGLIPAAVRQGRQAFYGENHLVRLELVRELQAHGFTLAAIEGYLERIPADAAPADVALHRTLLAPWLPDLPETLQRAELEQRAGRSLSDDDVELLVAMRVVEPTLAEDVFRVAPAHLAAAVGVLELGMPATAAAAVQHVLDRHARAIAEELTEVFRTQVWPEYRRSGAPAEQVQSLVERFKPLTVQALVLAYQSAVDETKRETVRRRS